MANFAVVADVRAQLFNNDPLIVTDELIERNLDDAHAAILKVLQPVFDTEDPEAALVRGEALLASAYVLSALLRGEAAGGYELQIGGNKLSATGRFDQLRAAADTAECTAWAALAPFLTAIPPRAQTLVTESRPLLGED